MLCSTAICLCAVQCILVPWTIRYLISYWAGETSENYEDRHRLRTTMGWVRCTSIRMASNNIVRVAATIAYCGYRYDCEGVYP